MHESTRTQATLAAVVALAICLVAAPAIAQDESPAPSPSVSASPAPSVAASPSPIVSPEPPASAAPPATTEPEATASPEEETPRPQAASPRATAAEGTARGPVPPIVEANEDAWPLANQSYNGHRSAGGPIDSSTIGDLGVAWTFPIESQTAFGALATNPLILDGVVYVQDLTSNVYGIDLETGEQIWKATYDVDQLGPNGVAVGYGKVFAVQGVNAIVALDLNDGSEIWATDLRTQNDSEGITIQPIVFDGRVYVSTVPGTGVTDFYSGGVAGFLYALDQETGQVVWNFSTVDSPDLWGNPEVNSGGGAWYPPTIEVQSGRTFWGIGNPGPFPGTEEFPSGSSRPGRNLYTDSVMAMTSDGQLDWFTQVRRHDLYDLDFQLSPILAQVPIAGDDAEGDREVVIGGGKNGEIVAMDRATGEILWRTSVGTHKNENVDPVPASGIEVYPGTLGGIETPMAFRDGVVFAAYIDGSTFYTPSGSQSTPIDERTGGIVAVDATNGQLLWESSYDVIPVGAVTAINDLVFSSTYDGRMFALDRETGGEVWTMQSPAGINGWPAIAGDTIVVPAGVGAQPMLIALRLGAEGELPPPPAPSPAPVASPGASPGAGVLSVTTTADAPLSFDTATLETTAGADVTVSYDNESSIPHNIAFYEGDARTDPILGRTDVETGPAVQDLTFTAPSEPGSYLFVCEVHPDDMQGTLVVS